ncbi:SGNH/GDSL hydrolase family protein [Engelhardtia mirabilis]|uniref:SGNH hydrolase-type esterase domain-containing protein n=1 Tax=Engelhardtia mirabilis TaxID=2528011 RepID=A0A518BQD6_9BACT|nr:hypothetical protein Pla133_42870 [Planctomycetes bacterium Pla133]QDV03497.1 hypothetical protein Pla86_42860 [Planctomycetes bacterium Pla86]
MAESPHTTRDPLARRALAVLLGALVALAVAAVFVPRSLVLRAVGVTPNEAVGLILADPVLQQAAVKVMLDAPETREALENRVAGQVDAIYDLHFDPEVGRIHLARLTDRVHLGQPVRTNGHGMRERDYAWSKPPDTTRIVLLGDSYVYGFGIAAEDRFGVELERRLRPFCPTARLEVLHLGVASWNLQAECAYLRRQLAELDPDLVVQLAFFNDLADSPVVRGFGTQAQVSSQAWLRGESVVRETALDGYYDSSLRNLMVLGLDWESRHRYALAARAVAELTEATRIQEVPYLFISMWGVATPLVRELLVPDLPSEQLAFVSTGFRAQREHWNAPNDRHFNPLASKRFGAGLSALIAERGLLEGWRIEPDAEAIAQRELIFDAGARESTDRSELDAEVQASEVGSIFRFPPDDRQMGAQATAGMVASGHLAPYGSFCLAQGGGSLVVRGEVLGHPALAGARTRVFVDEVEVGSIALDDSDAFPARFDVPEALRGRPYLSARLVADDYCYFSPQGLSITFRLESVSFE